MRATVIYPPRPGKKHGPCKGTCSHIQCILKRHAAARTCQFCNEVLGWEAEVIFNWRQPVHVACLEASIQRQAESLEAETPSADRQFLLDLTRGWLSGACDNEAFSLAFVANKTHPYMLTVGRISD